MNSKPWQQLRGAMLKRRGSKKNEANDRGWYFVTRERSRESGSVLMSRTSRSFVMKDYTSFVRIWQMMIILHLRRRSWSITCISGVLGMKPLIDFAYNMATFAVVFSLFVIAVVSLLGLIFAAISLYLAYLHWKYSHFPGPKRDSFFSGNIPRIISAWKRARKDYRRDCGRYAPYLRSCSPNVGVAYAVHLCLWSRTRTKV